MDIIVGTVVLNDVSLSDAATDKHVVTLPAAARNGDDGRKTDQVTGVNFDKLAEVTVANFDKLADSIDNLSIDIEEDIQDDIDNDNLQEQQDVPMSSEPDQDHCFDKQLENLKVALQNVAINADINAFLIKGPIAAGKEGMLEMRRKCERIVTELHETTARCKRVRDDLTSLFHRTEATEIWGAWEKLDFSQWVSTETRGTSFGSRDVRQLPGDDGIVRKRYVTSAPAHGKQKAAPSRSAPLNKRRAGTFVQERTQIPAKKARTRDVSASSESGSSDSGSSESGSSESESSSTTNSSAGQKKTDKASLLRQYKTEKANSKKTVHQQQEREGERNSAAQKMVMDKFRRDKELSTCCTVELDVQPATVPGPAFKSNSNSKRSEISVRKRSAISTSERSVISVSERSRREDLTRRHDIKRHEDMKRQEDQQRGEEKRREERQREERQREERQREERLREERQRQRAERQREREVEAERSDRAQRDNENRQKLRARDQTLSAMEERIKECPRICKSKNRNGEVIELAVLLHDLDKYLDIEQAGVPRYIGDALTRSSPELTMKTIPKRYEDSLKEKLHTILKEELAVTATSFKQCAMVLRRIRLLANREVSMCTYDIIDWLKENWRHVDSDYQVIKVSITKRIKLRMKAFLKSLEALETLLTACQDDRSSSLVDWTNFVLREFGDALRQVAYVANIRKRLP